MARLIPDTESHVQLGMRLARVFFDRRRRGKGTRHELHITQAELAAMLAIAASEGPCAACPLKGGAR